MGLCLICLIGCGVRGGCTGAWRARGAFQENHIGQGVQGRGNRMLRSLRTGLAWWGQALEEVASRAAQGCLVRILLDSQGLDSLLEIAGTIHRALMSVSGSRVHWRGGIYGDLVAGGTGGHVCKSGLCSNHPAICRQDLHGHGGSRRLMRS